MSLGNDFLILQIASVSKNRGYPIRMAEIQPDTDSTILTSTVFEKLSQNLSRVNAHAPLVTMLL